MENHVDDAVEVYRAGVRALPDNRLIQVGLGRALLRAGKKGEALPILEDALDGATDAAVLNNGAYGLVDYGSSAVLSLAERSALKAVEILETESVAATPETVNAGAFGRANLLLEAWDTLGWVYFAEGKDAQAEEYVRASWRSGEHGEVGLHLGEILEKKGDAAGAMLVYEAALSRIGGSAAVPAAAELHARMDGLKKKGVGVQDPHPERALQEQRTFHVPRPAGAKGSGVFVMQVSAAKTEHVAMVSGDEALRGLSEDVARLDLGLEVPKESHALLLRSGAMLCSTEAACELVLMPPESANVK